MSDLVEHFQDPKPATIGHLVMTKIERSPGIGAGFSEKERPDAERSFLSFLVANAEAFLAVQTIDGVDARELSVASGE